MPARDLFLFIFALLIASSTSSFTLFLSVSYGARVKQESLTLAVPSATASHATEALTLPPHPTAAAAARAIPPHAAACITSAQL